MSDRFKFRVWSEEDCGYMESIDIFRLTHSGKLVFNNDSLNREPECNPKRYICEQCTGLKDKNGKLIYEGDILEVKVFDKKNYNQKKQTYWTVEWHEHRNNHGFMVYGINRRWNAPVAINKLFNAEAVVVGNIHENPNLLGDKTNEQKS